MGIQDGKGMLDGIKARFGIGGSRDTDDGYYEEDYDEYAEYGDDFDDEGYEDDYDDYGAYSTPTTRPAGAHSASHPRLVSIDDVRASTQLPSSLTRDPLPPRHVTKASTSSRSSALGRTMVDSTLPPQMTPEGTAATAAAASRRHSSEGLESLFSSTVEEPEPPRTTVRATTSSVSPRRSWDPQDALSGGAGSTYAVQRSVDVVIPGSYSDVERVSKSLKAGDAVVLDLRRVSDDLTMRVLDFSFGVASALDARVSCLEPRVFALTRLTELTDAERVTLQARGLISR